MNLLIFNLSIDNNHPVLGFKVDWVEKLSKKFKKVFIITTKLKNHDLPENVMIFPLYVKKKNNSKFFLLFRFYKYLTKILFFQSNKIDLLFYHMTPKYLLMSFFLLFPLKLKKILWHTHGNVSLIHKIAFYLANKILTAGFNNNYVKKNNKIFKTGHGINLERFLKKKKFKKKNKIKILYLGRFSRIKKIDKVIHVMNNCFELKNYEFKLDLVGTTLNQNDYDYLRYIKKNLITKVSKKYINFKKPINFRTINNLMSQYDILINFSATKSVDKVVLEAMASGLLVFTNSPIYKNVFDKQLRKFYYCNSNKDITLAKKLQKLSFLSHLQKKKLSMSGIQLVNKKHNLNKLVEYIYKEAKSK